LQTVCVFFIVAVSCDGTNVVAFSSFSVLMVFLLVQ